MEISTRAPGSGKEPAPHCPARQRTLCGIRFSTAAYVPLLALCLSLCGAAAAQSRPDAAEAPVAGVDIFHAGAPNALSPAGGARAVSPDGSVTPAAVLFQAAPAAGIGRDRWAVGRVNPNHDDDYAYRLPYGDAVGYRVLQSYGSALSHRGSEYFTVDFEMPEGTLVHAARDGLVVLTEFGYRQGCAEERCAAWANYLVILHADGTTGEYFHLQPNGGLVKVGQRVTRGQPIARAGNTGFSSTPHLHFGVYRRSANDASYSLGVKFATRGGIVDVPRAGAYYQNLPAATAIVAALR
jgi:murein DD-endopeptidase MepM/ murein hydrolase activator NlpD